MPDDAEVLKERRMMVNALLDAVVHEQDMREKEILDRFYEQKARETLSAMLRDVATLPDEIITYCQQLIAPKPKDPAE